MPSDEQQQLRESFLYPTGQYQGNFTPQQLAFNANLQEFAQRVSLLCGLETNGKLSADETYLEIKKLWKLLKTSKKELLESADTEPPQDS